MSKEKSAEPYVFPGMTPFVDQAAEDAGLDLHQAGRARQGWHMAQLQQLLGQLPTMAPGSQQRMLDEHIYPVLESLGATYEAAKAAVEDAIAGCGIAAPRKAEKAKAKK